MPTQKQDESGKNRTKPIMEADVRIKTADAFCPKQNSEEH